MPVLNRPETQQKMPFHSRRSSSNIGKVEDVGTCNLPKKCLRKNNHKYYRKDPAMPAIILKNCDQRCLILSWVTVELDTHYKILAPLVLPLQHSDQRNCLGSGTEVKMDGLEPVFSSPVISFGPDMKEQTSHHPPDLMCSEKTLTSSSSASVQFKKRGSANKRTKSAISKSCSHQNCNLSSDSSGSGLDASIGAASDDLVKDASKVDKPVKRSSRKKIKKKRRRQKKPSSCNSDRAFMSEQGIDGTSALETCSNSGSALGDGFSLERIFSENATPLSDTLHDIIMEKADNEESSKDTVNASATTSKATSCSNDVELLETEASLPQDSAGDDSGSERLGIDERPLIIAASASQATKVTPSVFDGETLNAHLEESNIHAEITSVCLSDEYDAPVLDEFSDDLNNDVGINGSDGINNLPSLRKEKKIHPSVNEAVLDCSNCGTSFNDVTSGKGNSSCGTSYDSNGGAVNCNNYCPKVVADSDINSERIECDNQGCSSNDNFSGLLGKKGRQGRKYFVESNGGHRVSSRVNGYGWAGKETNYSLWQKVQKTDVEECFDPMDRDSVSSEHDASKGGSSFARQDTCMGPMEDGHEKSARSAYLDEISVQTDAHERSATIGADTFSLKLGCDSLRIKVSEKLKRETGSGSKIVNDQNFRKGSHTGKATQVRPTKMIVPQKDALDVSLPVNNYKSFGAGSGSSSFLNDCTDSFNYSSSEQLQDSQIRSQETKPLGDVLAVDAQASQDQTGTLSAVKLEVESESSSKFCKDKPGDCCLQTCNEYTPAEQEVYASQMGNSNAGDKCEYILQKWVPVVKKDAETLDNLSNSHLDDPSSAGWNLMSTKEEQQSTESHCHVPVANTGVKFLVPCSGSVNYTLSENEVTCEPRYDAPVIRKEQSSVHIAYIDHTIHKLNEQGTFINETDSSKISQAVTDAYRMQIESEGVQLATGSPLAEFERFLHAASPIIYQTYSVSSGDWLIGGSICRHGIPNISLGSLWQWYEMPGSYGLEVKAEDYHNSKRFGSDGFQFCAYFVPFLSAVQLFGQSRSSMSACNAMSNEKRKLIHAYVCSSDCWSASGQDQVCKASGSSACVSDSELLFEYFESEQPGKRRPFYEKIQELIRGNATSNSHIFGDPLKLESLHLHDLHPSSWYSIAWYPIYRIPDGNFRAAFLTYHALGHFVRNTSAVSLGVGASIASPVVGLQSYNAQGECWFQPRHFMTMQMDGPLHYNTSEVLKERLRTLEQTASVMSRASLHKGDLKLVNRQPDYEFFLSRGRWR